MEEETRDFHTHARLNRALKNAGGMQLLPAVLVFGLMGMGLLYVFERLADGFGRNHLFADGLIIIILFAAAGAGIFSSLFFLKIIGRRQPEEALVWAFRLLALAMLGFNIGLAAFWYVLYRPF